MMIHPRASPTQRTAREHHTTGTVLTLLMQLSMRYHCWLLLSVVQVADMQWHTSMIIHNSTWWYECLITVAMVTLT